jgi:hypothetical protein
MNAPPSATRIPVLMNGIAEGQRDPEEQAPGAGAERRRRALPHQRVCRTPAIVLISVVKNTPYAMMKYFDASSMPNQMIAIGIIATGEIGRITSISGSRKLAGQPEAAHQQAAGDSDHAADRESHRDPYDADADHLVEFPVQRHFPAGEKHLARRRQQIGIEEQRRADLPEQPARWRATP